MKKLNDVLETCNITVYSFQAFKDLEDNCNKDGEAAIISTLAPALMLDKGIDTYYSPIIPRNTIFNTPADIIAADLDVITTTVSWVDDITAADDVIIVSRHAGTVAILQEMFPHNTTLTAITPEDIQGKKVVGTLPPTLIQYAAAYKAATIKDFDYARDGDLSGDALKARLIVTGSIKTTTE